MINNLDEKIKKVYNNKNIYVITDERVAEITDMAESLTRNINLNNAVVINLEKVIVKLKNFSNQMKTDDALTM